MLPYFQHWSNQAHPAQFQRLYAYRHRVWTKVLPSQRVLTVTTYTVKRNQLYLNIQIKPLNVTNLIDNNDVCDIMIYTIVNKRFFLR